MNISDTLQTFRPDNQGERIVTDVIVVQLESANEMQDNKWSKTDNSAKASLKIPSLSVTFESRCFTPLETNKRHLILSLDRNLKKIDWRA